MRLKILKLHSNSAWFIIAIFLLVFTGELATQNEINPQVQEMIYSIEGLSNQEQQQLIQDLSLRFKSITPHEKLDPQILKNISAIISAGIFEQASLEIIGDVAYKAYFAERNGAPAAYIRDLALVGFSKTISASQLENAAKGIDQLMNARIDPLIIEEFIAYALYNGWNAEFIENAVAGLINGVKQGLEPKRIALGLIISIDKEKAQKSASQVVQEAIQFLKTLDQQQPQEAQRQQFAYHLYQESIRKGLPISVAEEVYFTAIEDGWSTNTIRAVYEGLHKGMNNGLTAERLATAIFVRLAQADQLPSPEKMVEQEIQYVASIEKKPAQLIMQDKKKYKRKQLPIDLYQMPYLQPPRVSKEQPVTYFNATNRSSIDQHLMWQYIQEFLGPPPTPYRWGGTSKSGIDCSGLVKRIFELQGIYLPRTSWQQYQVSRPVNGNLQFGDLVFFSKYGPAYQVTHVGIYIGGDKFVHSSASNGVMISSLNKRYYRLRFKGAKRVI